MTTRSQRPRAVRRDARPTADPPRLSETAREIQELRAHLMKRLMKTAIACAVIGGAFLLTSSQTLHSMAVFLLTWSGGWALAAATIWLQKLVKHGRQFDKS
jgi:hypothetical protein